jgi:peptide deformylase
MTYRIRLLGDPVLRQKAAEVTEIDGKIATICEGMFPAMYEAEGLGLAAPQVGIQKRLFVYDLGQGDGAQVIVNPRITETDGEFTYSEGCLSVPGMSFDIVRPNQVHLTGVDLDGNEVSIEADELLGRLFQHELDHLDGVLLLDHLDDDQRKAALREWRRLTIDRAVPATQAAGGLSLP